MTLNPLDEPPDLGVEHGVGMAAVEGHVGEVIDLVVAQPGEFAGLGLVEPGHDEAGGAAVLGRRVFALDLSGGLTASGDLVLDFARELALAAKLGFDPPGNIGRLRCLALAARTDHRVRLVGLVAISAVARCVRRGFLRAGLRRVRLHRPIGRRNLVVLPLGEGKAVRGRGVVLGQAFAVIVGQFGQDLAPEAGGAAGVAFAQLAEEVAELGLARLALVPEDLGEQARQQAVLAGGGQVIDQAAVGGEGRVGERQRPGRRAQAGRLRPGHQGAVEPLGPAAVVGFDLVRRRRAASGEPRLQLAPERRDGGPVRIEQAVHPEPRPALVAFDARPEVPAEIARRAVGGGGIVITAFGQQAFDLDDVVRPAAGLGPDAVGIDPSRFTGCQTVCPAFALVLKPE